MSKGVWNLTRPRCEPSCRSVSLPSSSPTGEPHICWCCLAMPAVDLTWTVMPRLLTCLCRCVVWVRGNRTIYESSDHESHPACPCRCPLAGGAHPLWRWSGRSSATSRTRCLTSSCGLTSSQVSMHHAPHVDAPRLPHIRKESPVGCRHVGSARVLACGCWCWVHRLNTRKQDVVDEQHGCANPGMLWNAVDVWEHGARNVCHCLQ